MTRSNFTIHYAMTRNERESVETGPDREWAIARCLSLKERGAAWMEVVEKRFLFNGSPDDFEPAKFRE